MRSGGAVAAGQGGRPEGGGAGPFQAEGAALPTEGRRSLGLTAATGGGPLFLLRPDHVSQDSIPFRQMPSVPTLCF